MKDKRIDSDVNLTLSSLNDGPEKIEIFIQCTLQAGLPSISHLLAVWKR